MNLLPDADQNQLLDTAVEFLINEAPVQGGETAAAMRARLARPFWKKIADLGWIGLGLEEDYGGVGLTLAEEALFFREFGRHLLPPTILGAVLGARVAAQSGAEELAAAIVAGERVVAVAVAVGAATVGEAVSGAFHVYDAENADDVLVCDETGAALLSLETFIATPAECLDDRLDLASATLDAAPASAFVAGDDIFRRGAVLAAAMLAGIAEATRDIAVDYAKTRHQFGKPIGAFQAIKHDCADMAVRCEGATAAVFQGALCVRDGRPTAELDASSAKALAGDAAMTNGSVCIQIHGGMGFTDQMTPHLYVKRARIIDQLFGDARSHFSRVLDAPAA